MANPKITIWDEPPKMETGAPTPALASCGSIFIAYLMHNVEFPGWDSGASPDHPGFREHVAVLKFSSGTFKFGYPNDEALSGHPLYKFGLMQYGFFLVENSPWIDELKNQNRVHLHHSDKFLQNAKHWVITFHDETFEVISRTASVFRVCDSSSPHQVIADICGEIVRETGANQS